MQTPILPVLDLMHRQIVRGIAGRRDEYRPIISQWTASAEPLTVARALRSHFGFHEFYLADLDAIRAGQPASDIYQQLQQDGFQLWIDAGLRTARDDTLLQMNVAFRKPLGSHREGEAPAEPFEPGSAGASPSQPANLTAYRLMQRSSSIVVGLESIVGPLELQRIAVNTGVERTVFSLDLKAGQPLGNLDGWPGQRTIDILQHTIETLGIRRVIVLDLANVGVGEGVSTEALCIHVKRAWPHVQLTAGGGVRGIEDVNRLVNLGVDRVLVASALHDGRITREML
jgi:phosphoribosylformimino-5-aminoimidazole carboxamide ribotide isomerase